MRSSSVPPPRPSYVRARGDLEQRLLEFAQSGDVALLDGFDDDAIREALQVRLAVEGPEAVHRYGERIVPAVVGMLSGEYDGVIACRAALACPNERYVGPLVELVVRGDPRNRAAAQQALDAHVEFLEPQLDAACAIVLDESQMRDWRFGAIALLGRHGDQRALIPLLFALAERDRGIGRAAHRALVELSGRDFGPMKRAWQQWVSHHSHLSRVDWLIDALDERRAELRVAALHTLERLLGREFDVEDASPRAEFVRLQSQLRQER